MYLFIFQRVTRHNVFIIHVCVCVCVCIRIPLNFKHSIFFRNSTPIPLLFDGLIIVRNGIGSSSMIRSRPSEKIAKKKKNSKIILLFFEFISKKNTKLFGSKTRRSLITDHTDIVVSILCGHFVTNKITRLPSAARQFPTPGLDNTTFLGASKI